MTGKKDTRVMKLTKANPAILSFLVSLLPMALLVLVFVHLAGKESTEAKERDLRNLAHAIGEALDGDIMSQIHQLEILATDDDLVDDDNLAGFHRQMNKAMERKRDSWHSLALADPQGQLLLSSLRPYGQALPKTGMPEQLAAVVRTASPLAYGVWQHGVLTTHAPILIVGAPILRGGAVKYVLNATFRPSSLNSLISSQNLPEDWLAVVLDPSQRVAGITKGGETLVGSSVAPSIAQGMSGAKNGMFFAQDMEGRPRIFVIERLEKAGWTMLMGAPAELVQNAPYPVLALGFLVLALALAASLLVFWLVTRGERLHRLVQARLLDRTRAAKAAAEKAKAELGELNRELEAEVQARTAEIQLAATVVQHTTEGVMITSPEAVILSINPAFSQITGYTAEEVVGKSVSLLRSNQHNHLFYQEIWDFLRQDGRWEGEIWKRRKDGGIYLERASVSAVKDPQGHTTHYVSVFNDITDARSKDDRIRHMAFHDALTGLPNRLLLEDRLTQGITAARREHMRLGLLFFDLDRFKIVNDNLGHHIGDFLLLEVARRVKACMRGADTLARLAGDEFVVIMADVGTPENCAILAQKIIESLGEAMEIQGHPIHIGASVGIAVFPEDGHDGAALMQCADTAMYAAKNAGRGVYRFFQSSMSERAPQRLEIENGLRQAAENNELCLHYQPKVDVKSYAVIGYEALLRWHHPLLGQIPPDEFIPIAEDAGLIGNIGEWVINEACRQIACWRSAGHGLKHVAINLSARQLRNGVLLEQILAATERHGVPPSALEVELTESAVMANPEEAAGIFQALRALGVRIAIDDFGTGYSSLAYLRRLPIDVIKVDKSFVMDADKNEGDAEIIRTILALGKTLKLHVVAEGVETDAQARLLEAAGCDIFQGFLFSRPMPAADTELSMAKGHARQGNSGLSAATG
jgi:diguanylate cyclase (GGDEF)-like protein/PAS domain S-box-containing protein